MTSSDRLLIQGPRERRPLLQQLLQVCQEQLPSTPSLISTTIPAISTPTLCHLRFFSRDRVHIQFVSHVLPPSEENACSQRGESGELIHV